MGDDSRHGFTFEVEDDVGTPTMRIRMRCNRCGELLTEDHVDVQQDDPTAASTTRLYVDAVREHVIECPRA